MNTLVIKLGATGDVVRTTSLLVRCDGQITWLTAAKNVVLLQEVSSNLRCLSWDERHLASDICYDLVINLEDTLEVGHFAKGLKSSRTFGAYVDATDRLRYTDDSAAWFDLSLISRYGRQRADELKLQNRRTYQELIFEGLGFHFHGEPYLLPRAEETSLAGDVAIAADSGPVWPMKKWAFYGELKEGLERAGLTVNVLPSRSSLLQHLYDVKSHRCLVGGDSLPMHLALGTTTSCVTLFNCTSPWEIHDYGVQKKIVSPRLAEFFYKRGDDKRATTAISVEEVFDTVMSQLKMSGRNGV